LRANQQSEIINQQLGKFMPIRCEIVSQDRTVFEGEVDIIVAPGFDGEMGILPHHSPVLTVLKTGVLKIRKDSQEQFFAI